jgi:hypothetical protein
MSEIKIYPLAGRFAENKDIARDIRVSQIIPSLEKSEPVILNFDQVDSVTQSFIHVLISDLFRSYGNEILDRMTFKSCNPTVQKIIGIVTDYMQESL